MNKIRYLKVGMAFLGSMFLLPTYAASAEDTTYKQSNVVLNQDEFINKTHDGCGIIEELLNPKYKKARIDSMARNDWDGLCVDGLAFGPGKMTYRNDKNEPTGFSEMWILDGRSIGRIKTTNYPKDNYAGAHYEGFVWKNESYTRSLNTKSPIEPQENQESLFIAHFPKDSKKWVTYSMYPSCFDMSNQTSSPCIVKSQHNDTDKYENGIKRYFCKIGQCVDKWNDLTSELLSQFDSFERLHNPEVELAKKSVELALLKARADKQKADYEAEIIVKENRLKAQILQNQQKLSQASLTKTPVASPALRELIRRTLNGGK